MNEAKLREAVGLAVTMPYFFIATANKAGEPHMALANRLAFNSPGLLETRFWSCPNTISNLNENARISIVVWDDKNNSGFQLLGRVESLSEFQVLDGYFPGEEEARFIPQSCWKIMVRVNSVLEFKHALHNDAEAGE